MMSYINMLFALLLVLYYLLLQDTSYDTNLCTMIYRCHAVMILLAMLYKRVREGSSEGEAGRGEAGR